MIQEGGCFFGEKGAFDEITRKTTKNKLWDWIDLLEKAELEKLVLDQVEQ